MTRDDIIRMAREAGFEFPADYDLTEPISRLERFANLVAAAEREACAKLCEEGGKDASGRIHVQAWGAAKAIRARGREMKDWLMELCHKSLPTTCKEPAP